VQYKAADERLQDPDRVVGRIPGNSNSRKNANEESNERILFTTPFGKLCDRIFERRGKKAGPFMCECSHFEGHSPESPFASFSLDGRFKLLT